MSFILAHFTPAEFPLGIALFAAGIGLGVGIGIGLGLRKLWK